MLDLKLEVCLKKKMHNISYFIIIIIIGGWWLFFKTSGYEIKNHPNNQFVWCHFLYLHNISFHMTEKHPILRGSIHLQKPSLICLMYLNTIVKPKNSIWSSKNMEEIFHGGNAHPLKISLGFNVGKK